MMKNFKGTWSLSPTAQRRRKNLSRQTLQSGAGSTVKSADKGSITNAKLTTRSGQTNSKEAEAAGPPGACGSKDGSLNNESNGGANSMNQDQKKFTPSNGCSGAAADRSGMGTQMMFARPKLEIAKAYLSPLCSASQTQQSGEGGLPSNSPKVDENEQGTTQLSGKESGNTLLQARQRRNNNKYAEDKEMALALDSLALSKQQRSHSVDSVAMVRSSKPAPAEHLELATNNSDNDQFNIGYPP